MDGSVAKGIETLLQERGLKQRVIAKKSGFTQQQFSDMLRGRKIIRADYLVQIAQAMGVSVQDIFDAGVFGESKEAM